MPSKPNILILMADQMSAPFLPFYAESPAQLPTLSRLADEGVLFNAAYSNSPLCGPARYTLQAGQLPSRTGAYDNACELTAMTPTMAHYLRLGGYRTVLAGKMHFVGPDQLHGFEERLTTDIYPADFGWTPDWTDFDHRPSWYHSMDSVLTAGPTRRTNQIDFDEEAVFATRRKLYDIVREDDGRPFFITLSLTHPHDPYACHESHWQRYDGVEIPMPRVPDQSDPHAQRLRHVCGQHLDTITDAQIRDARRAYFGSMSFVDDQFARVLETLEETGLRDDTIVIVCGDHGDMLGERGLWYKMNFHEGAARIPLIVHAPKRYAPRKIDACVSLVDLVPTLIELAGLTAEPATPLDGTSLVPHLENGSGHDEVIGEYMGEGVVAPMVMIRRGPWKFIHTPTDPDLLYNLADDPDELHNLAESADQSERMAALKAEVAVRWNFAEITQAVLASQSCRRLVGDANATGLRSPWDYQPRRDATQEYVRPHMDLEDLEAKARYPRVRS
ncbi:MAG: choline-sulfatase [Novosphingobium sp.]|uniref:choline-sulfatase n=1 Tax=Novosphingobium sp. TaxID=1874826 RepID=UPI0032BF0041